MHEKQQRRCVSCREAKHQTSMIRLAKFNNEIFIDSSFSGNGRGAYVCKNSQCINNAIKKRLFNRAFKLNLDNEIYVQLGEYEQNN